VRAFSNPTMNAQSSPPVIGTEIVLVVIDDAVLT
jgi:hypothetical protein